LHAVAVTSEEELTGLAVPDGKREHAMESLDAARAPGGVGSKYHLGVGFGEKAAPFALQLGSQLTKVVKLAVVGDDVVPGRIEHRLVALWTGINDRQAAVGQTDGTVRILALTVGAAV